MSKENEPAKLLLPYLQRADELQKHEPLVAYYCRLYAMERGLKIPQNERTKTTSSLLVSLINQLEKDKKSLKLDTDDHLHLEGFALNVFGKADKQDRAGRADFYEFSRAETEVCSLEDSRYKVSFERRKEACIRPLPVMKEIFQSSPVHKVIHMIFNLVELIQSSNLHQNQIHSVTCITMHSILQINCLLQQPPLHHLLHTSLHHLRKPPHKHLLHTCIHHIRQPPHRYLLHMSLHHLLHILVMSILLIMAILLIVTILLIISSNLHPLMHLKILLTPNRITINLMCKNHSHTCHSRTTLCNFPISNRILALRRAVFLLHHHITLLTTKELMLRIPHCLCLAL